MQAEGLRCSATDQAACHGMQYQQLLVPRPACLTDGVELVSHSDAMTLVSLQDLAQILLLNTEEVLD